ncbi:MAG: FAD-binding protein, partial [Planctomycetes bacterium]|nr:FAD-binding protein [Planctomycetota bacterium]
MSLWTGLEEIVEYDEPMSEHTWFRLGGAARYFIRPRNEKELKEVVSRCHDNSVVMYVLGRGSNVLIVDEGLDGAVVQLLDQHFGQVTIDGNVVRVGAGASLSKLVQQCARDGLSGMECMAGIPGSVGGAVKINAGGQFGDIGNVAQSVRVMDSSGYEFVRQRQDIYFGYRMTNIIAKFILEA